MPISRSSVGRQETARDRVRLAPAGPQGRLGREEWPAEERGRWRRRRTISQRGGTENKTKSKVGMDSNYVLWKYLVSSVKIRCFSICLNSANSSCIYNKSKHSNEGGQDTYDKECCWGGVKMIPTNCYFCCFLQFFLNWSPKNVCNNDGEGHLTFKRYLFSFLKCRDKMTFKDH